MLLYLEILSLHVCLRFCVMEQIPSSNEVTDSPVAKIPRTDDGSVDWSQVSSQLLNILFFLI